MQAAARATVEAKITAIGRALARGALADEPEAVDVKRLFVQAMADFETSHIRLLGLIAAAEFHTPPLLTTQELTELPWLPKFAVFPVLAALQRHLAVYSVGVGSVSVHNPDAGGGVVWGGQGIPGRWGSTPFGFTCLDRLREAGWEQEGGTE